MTFSLLSPWDLYDALLLFICLFVLLCRVWDSTLSLTIDYVLFISIVVIVPNSETCKCQVFKKYIPDCTKRNSVAEYLSITVFKKKKREKNKNESL